MIIDVILYIVGVWLSASHKSKAASSSMWRYYHPDVTSLVFNSAIVYFPLCWPCQPCECYPLLKSLSQRSMADVSVWLTVFASATGPGWTIGNHKDYCCIVYLPGRCSRTVLCSSLSFMYTSYHISGCLSTVDFKNQQKVVVCIWLGWAPWPLIIWTNNDAARCSNHDDVLSFGVVNHV